MAVKTRYSSKEYDKIYNNRYSYFLGSFVYYISDRGPQLAFHFWKSFQKDLRTQLALEKIFILKRMGMKYVHNNT